MKKLSLILFIIFLILNISKANNIDSLKNVINSGQIEIELISDAYAEIAFYYIESEFNPDSCTKYGNIGLELARNANTKNGILKNLLALGRLEYRKENIVKSDSLLSLAYQTDGVDKLTDEYISLLNLHGIVKELLLNYKGALKLYFEALNFAKQINDKNILASINNNISAVYYYLEEFDTAMKYILEASALFKETEDYKYYANSLVNIAEFYSAMNLSDSVRKVFPQYLKIVKQASNYYASANLYMIIGTVESEESNYNKALKYFETALTQIDSLENGFHKNYTKGTCLFDMGKTYFEIGKIKYAMDSFWESLFYAKEGSNNMVIKNSYLYLNKCYEQLNQPDSALVYYRKYHKIETLILEEKNSKEIARIEYNYNLQKQEKEQELKELVLKSEIKNLRIITISISILLILVLALIYLIIKNRKRKIIEARLIEKNLSLKIENREKELTTNVLYLLKKNEFLANLTDTLQELNNRILPENKTYLRRIIRDIERNTFTDSWEEFEKRFQDVHVDFYKKLSVEFSELTPNELKLCAFLKLNMTSKDISAITNQSVDSLKVARYRLRKKLGLSREDNLITFLTKF
ncbi:MAG: hypothetical protein GQ525_12610 [Draconibacterium sp.]|nr:hypothetical protein [Draconibacterium sp.]